MNAATVSGASFSVLAFEMVAGLGDSVGLLMGETRQEVTNVITDTHMDNIEHNIVVDIQNHVPCPQPFCLYNNAGTVDKELLNDVIGGAQVQVIGWYKFRRNTPQQISLLEHQIHRSMQTALDAPDLFFLLFTTRSSENHATYALEHRLFKWLESCRRFITLPMTITNLGQVGQQEYWASPISSRRPSYIGLVDKHKHKFMSKGGDMHGVKNLIELNCDLQNRLQKKCKEVLESEKCIECLQAEVNSLKKKLRERRQQVCNKEDEKGPARVGGVKNHELLKVLRQRFPSSEALKRLHISCKDERQMALPQCKDCCREPSWDLDDLVEMDTAMQPLVVLNEIPSLAGSSSAGTSTSRRHGSATDLIVLDSTPEKDDSSDGSSEQPGYCSPVYGDRGKAMPACISCRSKTCQGKTLHTPPNSPRMNTRLSLPSEESVNSDVNCQSKKRSRSLGGNYNRLKSTKLTLIRKGQKEKCEEDSYLEQNIGDFECNILASNEDSA
uniref:BRISC complex subunit Abraxas 2-like n=1 Tax=Myxine glutinosa TaxID=7769 RepID=UPI00358E6F8F